MPTTSGDRAGPKTIIFASTDGGSDGAEGARKLIEDLPDADLVDEAIVISQPGVPDPEAPFVIGSGADPESASAQLVQTARGIATATFGQRDPAPGPWVGLSRLAFPVGIGEQVGVRRAGTEAIAISAHGERQLPASEDEADTISSETLAAAGSTMIDLIVTLDERRRRPTAGPDDYIRVGDNLVPGWTLSLLAITLLIAAAADRRRHLAARAPQRLAGPQTLVLGGRARPAPARRRSCSPTCSGSSG